MKNMVMLLGPLIAISTLVGTGRDQRSFSLIKPSEAAIAAFASRLRGELKDLEEDSHGAFEVTLFSSKSSDSHAIMRHDDFSREVGRLIKSMALSNDDKEKANTTQVLQNLLLITPLHLLANDKE